ncbi:sensor histidine kinase [Actinomadura sp. WMMA1423]|uniref:sensor histidine kinase n=1 Tax=Actinomadura sp. WMMA1423 TaxID=2591108 RepID=UPI001146E1AF|nr:ATP-binding protein [Actinomadura sp. WMMA1423]
MRNGVLRQAGTAAAGTPVLLGAAGAPVYGWTATVPVAVAVAAALAVLAMRPARHEATWIAAAVAGGVSLAATATAGASPGARFREGEAPQNLLGLVEVAALTLLVALVVRAAAFRGALAGAGLAGAAVPCWILRFGVPGAAGLAALAAWSLPPVLAVTTGLYLRSLDDRRRRSVASARRRQRLQLASDLHDFVAHDVGEMLAQARAGQILAERDPSAAARTLTIIEEAALRAMASMDRTLGMLRDDAGSDGDGATLAPAPSLADLPDLAARFTASGTAPVHLDLDPDLDVPREVGTTAYRVVVEALTNVRRHAPGAGRVDVSVRRSAGAAPSLRVLVADDAPGGGTGPAARRGGLGLPGLRERVEMLGGTLTAGPREPSGWRVAAVLPLEDRAPRARRR